MAEKKLKPVIPNNKLIEKMEKALEKYLRDEFYAPIAQTMDITKKQLDKKRTENTSRTALQKALIDGRIHYYRGQFTGRFSVAISKELRDMGAKFDRSKKSYRLLASQLPLEIRQTIDMSAQTFQRTLAKAQTKIDSLVPAEIVKKINVAKIFDTMIFEVDEDLGDQLEAITTYQKLTPEQRATIAEQYNENMKTYAQGFLEEEVQELRQKIQTNTEFGVRYEEIVESIEERYQVSRSKAKFLARQESHLLNTELQKTRNVDAGVEEYEWVNVAGSPSHPVRPRHKELNRTRHRWDDPPIISEAGRPERRGHPGQDFNCRCRARSIVRF